MTTTNVNNGTTTNTVDTSNLTGKQYNVRSNYQSNNTYQNTQYNSILNIQSGKVMGDCTTADEWGVVSDSEELLDTLPAVDEAGVHSGTYKWVYWKKPVPMGASLSVEGTITNNSCYIICGIIGNSPTRYPNNNSERMVGARELDIIRDTGSIELQYYEITINNVILQDSVVISTVNSNFTLEVVPKTDSTDVYVDGVKYTTGALLGKNGDVPDSYYYRFRKWTTGEIRINSIEYESL